MNLQPYHFIQKVPSSMKHHMHGHSSINEVEEVETFQLQKRVEDDDEKLDVDKRTYWKVPVSRDKKAEIPIDNDEKNKRGFQFSNEGTKEKGIIQDGFSMTSSRKLTNDRTSSRDDI